MALLDKFGNVFEAQLDSVDCTGAYTYELNPVPLTSLGAGRPLGSHYDHEGNLIVCDSLKVWAVQSDAVSVWLSNK
jgi:hypothetical protein